VSGLFAELEAACGGEAVTAHEPLACEGQALSISLRPRDGETLARGLGVLAARESAALVRGGGSRMGIGNLASRADCLLRLDALAGIETLDAEDGVARVRAGTRLGELRAAANAEGWDPPLDPPGEGATVGGVLSAAAVGPRRLGFGPPRDCVLGLEVALASGERTRCGGRVVKNVTGYDLAKLYTGAFGSLGVIEAAWLRLRPLPAAVEVRVAELAPGSGAFERGIEVARRSSARAVALVAPRPAERIGTGCLLESGWALVVELAGDAPSVERDARWLEDATGALPPEADVVAALRQWQGEEPPAEGARVRIAVPPSALERTCAELAGLEAELVVHPGLGLVYAATAGDLEGALFVAQRAAAVGGGHALFESLPAAMKDGRDVFGTPAAQVPLMRALKQRFDPQGVLNPGRFAGGI
jgi:glycolate oxidase FAD binding subunit